jgi:hypothetical protein
VTTVVTVAVDTRARDLATADHVVHDLDGVVAAAGLDGYLATTHLVDAGGAHFAVAAEWVGADDSDAQRLAQGLAGVFPGSGVVVDADDRRIVSGPAELADGAEEALERHRRRTSGRLARFPGQAAIERRLTVADIVAESCVDEVVGLAGVEVNDGSVVDLTGFVRPTWKDGRCIVTVQPAAQGLIPFEVRDQIPCCSNH